MIVINTCESTNLQIIMDNREAFKDLKEFLSAQGIGFREIYDGDQFTLQFVVNSKLKEINV